MNWGSIPAEIKDWKLKKFYGDEEYAPHLMPSSQEQWRWSGCSVVSGRDDGRDDGSLVPDWQMAEQRWRGTGVML